MHLGIDKLKTLGICNSYTSPIDLEVPESINYETISLYKEGNKVYDKVILFAPSQVTYKFIDKLENPVVNLGNQDLTSLTTLIVRRTKGHEKSTAVLAHSLLACGCDVIDPIDRFKGNSPSKRLTTLSRHKRRVGISSYMAFELEGALQLIYELADEGKLPLLTKPVDGSQGEGVQLLADIQTAIEYARCFFSQAKSDNTPILLQEFVNFQSEYRVILIDGKCLGVVQKKKAGTLPANAAQGADFVAVDAPNVVNFVVHNESKQGILGVDVGQDFEGKFYIIEANRAPQWRAFEEATGVNVAEKIIDCAIKRIALGL